MTQRAEPRLGKCTRVLAGLGAMLMPTAVGVIVARRLAKAIDDPPAPVEPERDWEGAFAQIRRNFEAR